jgi:hypothetical protein
MKRQKKNILTVRPFFPSSKTIIHAKGINHFSSYSQFCSDTRGKYLLFYYIYRGLMRSFKCKLNNKFILFLHSSDLKTHVHVLKNKNKFVIIEDSYEKKKGKELKSWLNLHLFYLKFKHVSYEISQPLKKEWWSLPKNCQLKNCNENILGSLFTTIYGNDRKYK